MPVTAMVRALMARASMTFGSEKKTDKMLRLNVSKRANPCDTGTLDRETPGFT